MDGSGRTWIGSNLSPRVPDLRQAATQRLSDGQLHFLIAYGVRFTGMPALQAAHRERGEDAWQLVTYLRTLPGLGAESQTDPQQQVQSAGSAAKARYVGSKACAGCHREIYERWRHTAMANVVRSPQSAPDAFAAAPEANPVFPFARGDVALIYGSIWKQRYFKRVGRELYPLPVQWDFATRSWLPYHVPAHGADWWASSYPDSNFARPTGPTCDGCHSVGFDRKTETVAEWNVGCERCHGPGSEHVRKPTRSNMVNPATMSAAAETDLCIQCHSQGRPVTEAGDGRGSPRPAQQSAQQYVQGPADWPVGFALGLRLEDYWKLEECRLGQTNFYYYPDCTAHKNRMQGNDFVQSVMYRHQIRCSDCHDAHGTGQHGLLRKPAQSLCLECHGPGSPNGPREGTIAAHTHHKADSAGSQCVACHMPAIESEGVPGAGEFVHAHTFRVITPSMTRRYGMPNPCTSCHRNQTTAWAETAMSNWSNTEGWHLQ